MTTGLYVRWRAGEPREQRVFGPLNVEHPLSGQPCLICGVNLFGGIDRPRDIQLLVLGPSPTDEENLVKARAGRWHNAVALAVHASCLDPTRPDVVPLTEYGHPKGGSPSE